MRPRTDSQFAGILVRNALVLVTGFAACGDPSQPPPSPYQGWTNLSRLCALYSDSTAHCVKWTADGVISIQPVPGDSKVLDVAGGWTHHCLITVSGTLACWGFNRFGQLGDSTTTDHAAPGRVLIDFAFTQVSVGPHHTCGVTSGGELYCWGANASGQLGVPTTELCFAVPCAKAPQRVNFDTPIRSVSAAGSDPPDQSASGVGFTCAVTVADEAYCWGSNDLGQLGIGSRDRALFPTRLPLTGVRELTGGGNHTCAVQGPNSAVYCWGYNGRGQLGVANQRDSSCLSGDVGLPCFTLPRRTPLAGYRALDAYGEVTCGIDASDTAFCWGMNRQQQLGAISEIGEYTRVPQRVSESRAQRVTPTWSTVCFLSAEGDIQCRGNHEAELRTVPRPR